MAKKTISIHTLPALERGFAYKIRRYMIIRWALLVLIVGSMGAVDFFTTYGYAFGLMSILCGLMIILGGIYAICFKRLIQRKSRLYRGLYRFANIQVALDGISLVSLVYITGMLTSPFLLVFLVYSVISAMLIEPPQYTKHIAAICGLIVTLSMLEYIDYIPHFFIAGLLPETLHYDPVYVASVLVGYVGIFSLVSFVSIRIGARLQQRDKKLSMLEEDLEDAQFHLSKYDRHQARFLRQLVETMGSSVAETQSILHVIAGGYIGQENPRLTELVHNARARMDVLNDLVMDLQKLATDDTEALKNMFEMVDVRFIIEKMVNEFRTAHHDKKMVIEYTPPEETVLIGAKPADIEEVFFQLLQNALIYTRFSGTIRVAVHVTHHICVVEIADTGIGVLPADNARIYDEFYRGKNARELVPDSTGLGLSIAKRFMVQYAGRISHEPNVPHGTVFKVEFPRKGMTETHANDRE